MERPFAHRRKPGPTLAKQVRVEHKGAQRREGMVQLMKLPCAQAKLRGRGVHRQALLAGLKLRQYKGSRYPTDWAEAAPV